MSFLELFENPPTMRQAILPASMESCPECGRTDLCDNSATDEAATFLETHEHLEGQLHELIVHDYCADFIDAYQMLIVRGLEDTPGTLQVMAEMALSFYALALKHLAEERIVI